MNFATTKERIIQYLDFKGITLSNFFKDTGIKRGFLDTDKLKASVSDVNITIIIANYKDLNLEWLLTGNGSMLVNNNSNYNQVNSMVKVDDFFNNKIIEAQQKTIEILEQRVEDLKLDKDLFKKIIEVKL